MCAPWSENRVCYQLFPDRWVALPSNWSRLPVGLAALQEMPLMSMRGLGSRDQCCEPENQLPRPDPLLPLHTAALLTAAPPRLSAWHCAAMGESISIITFYLSHSSTWATDNMTDLDKKKDTPGLLTPGWRWHNDPYVLWSDHFKWGITGKLPKTSWSQGVTWNKTKQDCCCCSCHHWCLLVVSKASS